MSKSFRLPSSKLAWCCMPAVPSSTTIEFANKAMNAAMRASSNNKVINLFLVGSCIALSVRSMNQKNDIEALEADKALPIKSNKATKQTMRDWKQQLLAEAAIDAPVVPLSRLKAIYGEAIASQIGDAVKEDSKPHVPKFVV